jgi:hypothetical protein
MAQGTFTLFEEFSVDISGVHDLSADSFYMALIDNTTVAAAGDVTPQLADYTQVAGGNGYTTGGESLTTSWTEVVAGTGMFDATGDPCCSWTKNASGPTNIYQALVYNSTDANDTCVGFIDMTTDGGTTPISLQSGDISITPHASGFFRIS